MCKQVVDLIEVEKLKSKFYPALERYWAGLTFLLKSKLPLRSIEHISLTGHKVLNFISWLDEYPDIKLYIWEPSSTYSDFYIPLICKTKGLKVIALPHNIESLVSKRQSTVSGMAAPTWFNEELELLRSCDSVLTISSEEEWLLTLYGVEAKFLKYFPSPLVIEQFKRIKVCRAQVRPEGPLLMLGTASNPPTREGMNAVIDYFVLNKISTALTIAGYGTEDLANDFPELPENIIIEGTVDTALLNSLLIECKAVLVYQRGGAGALTKLQEFLIGGIPVIANSTALRSYQNIKGFYVLESLEHLDKLTAVHLEPPEWPQAAAQATVEANLSLITQTLNP